MEYHLSFDAEAVLLFKDSVNFKDEGGKAVTERQLFEAFWILYHTLDNPQYGDETKLSIRAEDEITAKSVAGGSIRLSYCAGCGNRVAQHKDVRTLAEGVRYLDLRFGEKTIEYVKKVLARWTNTPTELRRYSDILHDRLAELKAMTAEDIDKKIAERSAPKPSETKPDVEAKPDVVQSKTA